MSHRLLVLPRAERQLAKLPSDHFARVRDTIRVLATDPRPVGCRKLKGREGYRLRIGTYRIVYAIDDREKVVTVLDVGHRRDVYR